MALEKFRIREIPSIKLTEEMARCKKCGMVRDCFIDLSQLCLSCRNIKEEYTYKDEKVKK